jgi:anti-sigma regulatory factor (Ser/Thr protein kinase)
MARIDIAPITQWITTAAVQHGDALPAHLMQRLQISRRKAGLLLKKLVALQWLTSNGTPRKPLHRPGPLRQVVKRYALDGLQEDLPWRLDFAPCFELPAEVARMAQHAFTELLNNAIDHSGGSTVTVSMRQTPLQLQLLVSDDGCGLFERIAQTFAVQDARLAMLELSKGKLTSAPDHHSGHGLFFTSRLADVFDIHANATAFQCRAWDSRGWHVGRPASRSGTSIYLAITLDTPRTLDAVLRAHSSSGQGYGFDRTRVSLGLITGGVAVAGSSPRADTLLASRAEARRALHRLDQFGHAEIDFSGIAQLGHGFADEMFRVFSRQHPAVELLPVGMSSQVAAMIDSVRTQQAVQR